MLGRVQGGAGEQASCALWLMMRDTSGTAGRKYNYSAGSCCAIMPISTTRSTAATFLAFLGLGWKLSPACRLSALPVAWARVPWHAIALSAPLRSLSGSHSCPLRASPGACQMQRSLLRLGYITSIRPALLELGKCRYCAARVLSVGVQAHYPATGTAAEHARMRRLSCAAKGAADDVATLFDQTGGHCSADSPLTHRDTALGPPTTARSRAGAQAGPPSRTAARKRCARRFVLDGTLGRADMPRRTQGAHATACEQSRQSRGPGTGLENAGA